MVNDSLIYLDYAAATPLDAAVLRAMVPYLTDSFFNPSSPYDPAVRVRHEYEAAKERIARTIGARGTELVMTAGATESINLAFSCVKGHVVSSAIEHHAVRAAAKQHEHTFVAVDHYGRVDPMTVTRAIQPNTELVSIALANNEIGTVQPIRAIAAEVARERTRRRMQGDMRPIYLHTDASQGLGLLDIQVARLGVDMITLNAGKVYGPKQVGALWLTSNVVVAPVIVGGGQERGLRSGTENVAGVIGFAEALARAVDRSRYETDRLRRVRDDLQAKLQAAFPEAIVSGHPKHRLANFLHISFPQVDAERVLFALEMRGVLVATGSACAANKGTRSHVLEAIGLAAEVADGSIRMSLGQTSTEETCSQAARHIIEVVTAEYARSGRGRV